MYPNQLKQVNGIIFLLLGSLGLIFLFAIVGSLTFAYIIIPGSVFSSIFIVIGLYLLISYREDKDRLERFYMSVSQKPCPRCGFALVTVDDTLSCVFCWQYSEKLERF